jgi:hypothetical protein
LSLVYICHSLIKYVTPNLIHALRHGLVSASTLQQILDMATMRADKRIIWRFPERPVICQISLTGHTRCDLDSPSGVDQLRPSIKSMGLISNILTRVTIHATRLGATKDVAHLPEKPGSGGVNNDVRQALGHHFSSFHRGTTQTYAGHTEREYYNERAKRKYDSIWSPRFSGHSAQTAVTAPVSDVEIQVWQDENEPPGADRNSKLARKRARNSVRTHRHEEFWRVAAPESNEQSERIPLIPMAGHQLNVMQSSTVLPETKSNPSVPSLGVLHAPSTPVGRLSMPDGDALINAVVDELEFERLQSPLGLTDTASQHRSEGVVNRDNIIAIEEIFQMRDDNLIAQGRLGDFVSSYSRVNIVCSEMFAKTWRQFEAKTVTWSEGPGLHSAMGNPRDPPVPWLFRCSKTPGCQYTSVIKGAIIAHEEICSAGLVLQKDSLIARSLDFRCPRSGCGKAFESAGKLNAHTKEQHDFEPKACTFNVCDPNKIYKSLKVLQEHISQHHSGNWPPRCLYPDCASNGTFKPGMYRLHLYREHKLENREAREPYMPTKQAVRTWDTTTTCPILGCSTVTKFSRRNNLRAHIKNKHGYSSKDATAATEFGHTLKPYVEWLKAKRTDRTNDK